jgi:hypothetical protein
VDVNYFTYRKASTQYGLIRYRVGSAGIAGLLLRTSRANHTEGIVGLHWHAQIACASRFAMERTAGKESGYRAIPHRSMRRQSGGTLVAMLCTACIVLFASEASAQCTARDVLQKRLTLKTAPRANTPIPVKSAFTVPMWKTITVGTFKNSFWRQLAVASIPDARKYYIHTNFRDKEELSPS